MKFKFALILIPTLAFSCARTHQKVDAPANSTPQVPAGPDSATPAKAEVAVTDQEKSPQILMTSSSFKNHVDRENALKNENDPINQVLALRTRGALRIYSIVADTSPIIARLATVDGKSSPWMISFATTTKEEAARLWSQLDIGRVAMRCETATIAASKMMIKCSEYKIAKKLL